MILDKIIKNKRKEIKEHKKNFPLSSFKPFLKKSDRGFKQAISKKFSLIAEIKKISPSSGLIRKNFNSIEIAKAYEKSEAAAISVLTDPKYFGGTLNKLKEVSLITKKPILRKDFILEKYQVYESRYYGANAILLIARILTKTKIKNLIIAAKRYNLDCLVEIHDESDLRKLPTNVEIIGINNRNLDTLKINLNTTLSLAKKIPKDKIIVTESGYYTNIEIRKIKNKVNAALVGTSILKEKDINGKIRELLR